MLSLLNWFFSDGGGFPSDAKAWSQDDKAIYEEQLEHLHSQLTEALIENQELKSEWAGHYHFIIIRVDITL